MVRLSHFHSKCSVFLNMNELLNHEFSWLFHSHKIFRSFISRNERSPYTFMYLNYWNPYPFTCLTFEEGSPSGRSLPVSAIKGTNLPPGLLIVLMGHAWVSTRAAKYKQLVSVLFSRLIPICLWLAAFFCELNCSTRLNIWRIFGQKTGCIHGMFSLIAVWLIYDTCSLQVYYLSWNIKNPSLLFMFITAVCVLYFLSKYTHCL